MSVLMKMTYCNIRTTLNQYWESLRASKILSAAHMRLVGL